MLGRAMPGPSTSGVTFPGMRLPSPPEARHRRPLPGSIDAALMPAPHALEQARKDDTASLADAEPQELWACPGGGRTVMVAIQRALVQLRATLSTSFGEIRPVGRAGLRPTTRLRIVRGLGLSGSA
jgi:hypothetical protein